MTSVRIIGRDNGAGLSRDLWLLRETVARAGFDVTVVGFGGERGINSLRRGGLRLARAWRGRADLQIFVERIYPDLLDLGRNNLLLPNPEWFPGDWLPHLARFDGVLCKTRHAVAIFDGLSCVTRYVGFTSEDRLDPTVARERSFFHLAGRSSAKGTAVLLQAWHRHPEWPRLTVVQSAKKAEVGSASANIHHRIGYLDDGELRTLQNRCLFHACPSEMEGFGHSLMEAMSVGALTLTTDGVPMNELVASDRGCLVPALRETRKDLAPRYFVDIAGIETGVEWLLALETGVVADMTTAARDHFLIEKHAFRTRLCGAVLGALAKSHEDTSG